MEKPNLEGLGFPERFDCTGHAEDSGTAAELQDTHKPRRVAEVAAAILDRRADLKLQHGQADRAEYLSHLALQMRGEP